MMKPGGDDIKNLVERPKSKEKEIQNQEKNYFLS